MKASVSAQFGLYALDGRALGPELEAVVGLLQGKGLNLQTGPMSSTITGESAAVFGGLRDAFDAMAEGGATLLVTSISNAC